MSYQLLVEIVEWVCGHQFNATVATALLARILSDMQIVYQLGIVGRRS